MGCPGGVLPVAGQAGCCGEFVEEAAQGAWDEQAWV